MDKLASYRLDKAYTEGVELRLDNAPDVVFLVRLPSEYNRAYVNAIYGDVEFGLDENGQAKTNTGLVQIKQRQEEAFVTHCMISVDGDRVPADFITHYPKAVAELWSKAQDLARDLDARVDTTVKKSSISSGGPTNGEENKSYTPNLNAEAS